MYILQRRATLLLAIVALGVAAPGAAQQQGGRITGILADPSDVLRPGDTAIIVRRVLMTPFLLQGSGPCFLDVRVNEQTGKLRSPSGGNADGVYTLPGRIYVLLPGTGGPTTIRVLGKRGCSGDASLTVYLGGELRTASVQAPTVGVGQLAVAVSGRGLCEQVVVRDSRSGQSQQVRLTTQFDTSASRFSGQFRTAVATPGPDTLTITPAALCVGAPRRVALTVVAGAPPSTVAMGTVTGVYVAGAGSGIGFTTGQSASIGITGTGAACRAIRLEFGDGSVATVGGAFPLATQHVYTRPGAYAIVATGLTLSASDPATACAGTSTAGITVQQPKTVIVAVSAPATATVGQTVSIAVSAKGPACSSARVLFGDGTEGTLNAPGALTHVYRNAGTFALRANGTNDCVGDAGATIAVTRRAADQAEVDRELKGAKRPVKP